MKDRATMETRNRVMGLLGLALSAWLIGFAASPAMALSITDPETDSAGGSVGATSSPALAPGVTADGFVGDFAKYLRTHWAAAFPTTAPGLDGVKAIGAPGATPVSTGKQRLDLFFADAHARQSGPEPARLLLFGAALVGLGAAVRRRMRGVATPSV